MESIQSKPQLDTDPLDILFEKTQDVVASNAEAMQAILDKGINNVVKTPRKAIWLQHTMKLDIMPKVLQYGRLSCQYTVNRVTGSNAGSGVDDMKKGLAYYVFTRLPYGKYNAASYPLSDNRVMWFIDGQILQDRYFWAFKGDAGVTEQMVPRPQNPVNDKFKPTAGVAAISALIKERPLTNEVALLGDIPINYIKAIAMTPKTYELTKSGKPNLWQQFVKAGIQVIMADPMDTKLDNIPDVANRVESANQQAVGHRQNELFVRATLAENTLEQYRLVLKLLLFAILTIMVLIYASSSSKLVGTKTPLMESYQQIP